MKAHDRNVAGIRCSEVLDDLSAYLDGELGPPRVERIEAHLRGCNWCERFGGDFAASVVALRQRLGAAPAPPADVHERLMKRLEDVQDGGAPAPPRPDPQP